MHRNQSVNLHSFAMIPRADIPRSSFDMQKSLKTAINAGLIYPVFCEEVLPGDTWRMSATMFARLATPIFPFMDNLYMDVHWFFVPNRLVWDHWPNFMGEQEDPDSTIDYVIPQQETPVGGPAFGSLHDYFGIPCAGQIDAAAADFTINALPFRGYRLIWNQWYRDENLQESADVLKGDGPDPYGPTILPRGKRHDYFTSCLPWPEKGGVGVPLPLGDRAPVVPISDLQRFPNFSITGHPQVYNLGQVAANQNVQLAPVGVAPISSGTLGWENTALEADLSAATAATINELRMAFQIQRLLERDARGGTRYTEVIRSHFGVVSPDARLQRPEYLGGSTVPIVVNPIPQTSATSAAGTDTPQGNLAAMGTALSAANGFSQSFVEHGYVFGLVSVRADLTYQQGLRRHWSRSTRYDFYFPVFANLGEQAVLRKEIYCTGVPGDAADDAVFGYQERWGEYRYLASEITGIMRSYAAQPIDQWHLSEFFATPPVLDATFIEDPTNGTLSRVLAVGEEAAGQQLLLDCFFKVRAARPMPMYSVPGLIDHF